MNSENRCPFKKLGTNSQCELEEGHAGKHRYTINEKIKYFGKTMQYIPLFETNKVYGLGQTVINTKNPLNRKNITNFEMDEYMLPYE